MFPKLDSHPKIIPTILFVQKWTLSWSMSRLLNGFGETLRINKCNFDLHIYSNLSQSSALNFFVTYIYYISISMSFYESDILYE